MEQKLTVRVYETGNGFFHKPWRWELQRSGGSVYGEEYRGWAFTAKGALREGKRAAARYKWKHRDLKEIKVEV